MKKIFKSILLLVLMVFFTFPACLFTKVNVADATSAVRGGNAITIENVTVTEERTNGLTFDTYARVDLKFGTDFLDANNGGATIVLKPRTAGVPEIQQTIHIIQAGITPADGFHRVREAVVVNNDKHESITYDVVVMTGRPYREFDRYATPIVAQGLPSESSKYISFEVSPKAVQHYGKLRFTLKTRGLMGKTDNLGIYIRKKGTENIKFFYIFPDDAKREGATSIYEYQTEKVVNVSELPGEYEVLLMDSSENATEEVLFRENITINGSPIICKQIKSPNNNGKNLNFLFIVAGKSSHNPDYFPTENSLNELALKQINRLLSIKPFVGLDKYIGAYTIYDSHLPQELRDLPNPGVELSDLGSIENNCGPEKIDVIVFIGLKGRAEASEQNKLINLYLQDEDGDEKIGLSTGMTFVHEFGHVFGNLSDEYVDFRTASELDYFNDVRSPNCARNAVSAINKWGKYTAIDGFSFVTGNFLNCFQDNINLPYCAFAGRYVEDFFIALPLPGDSGMWKDGTSGTVSDYKCKIKGEDIVNCSTVPIGGIGGGCYYSNEYIRPSVSSIMKDSSTNNKFNPPSEDHLCKQIKKVIGVETDYCKTTYGNLSSAVPGPQKAGNQRQGVALPPPAVKPATPATPTTIPTPIPTPTPILAPTQVPPATVAPTVPDVVVPPVSPVTTPTEPAPVPPAPAVVQPPAPPAVPITGKDCLPRNSGVNGGFGWKTQVVHGGYITNGDTKFVCNDGTWVTTADFNRNWGFRPRPVAPCTVQAGKYSPKKGAGFVPLVDGGMPGCPTSWVPQNQLASILSGILSIPADLFK